MAGIITCVLCNVSYFCFRLPRCLTIVVLTLNQQSSSLKSLTFESLGWGFPRPKTTRCCRLFTPDHLECGAFTFTFTNNMRLVRVNRLPSNPGRGAINVQCHHSLIPRILVLLHLVYPHSSPTNELNRTKTHIRSQFQRHFRWGPKQRSQVDQDAARFQG